MPDHWDIDTAQLVATGRTHLEDTSADGVSLMTTPAHRIAVANAQDLIGEAQGVYGQVLRDHTFAMGPDLVEELPKTWTWVFGHGVAWPNRKIIGNEQTTSDVAPGVAGPYQDLIIRRY